MFHELTGEVGGNYLHLKRLKMEIEAHRLNHSFYPAIGVEIPLAGGHQYLPCVIFKAKDHHGDDTRHHQNAEEHLAENFQMLAERQQFDVTRRVVRRRHLRLPRFLLFLLRVLRHSPRLLHQHLPESARSSLS